MFAVVGNQNTDPFAISAAANFIIACQDQATMAAALDLASEAPAGVLDREFLRDQSTRVDTKVVTALAHIVGLFQHKGDENIDFFPKSKKAMDLDPTPRRLKAQISKTTSATTEGKLANRLRLYPFQCYLGELATAAGDIHYSDAMQSAV